jgi:hypothetical protein
MVEEAQKFENSSSSDVIKSLRRKVEELVDGKETKRTGGADRSCSAGYEPDPTPSSR